MDSSNDPTLKATPSGVSAASKSGATPPEVASAPPQAKVGKFVCTEKIGSGGMGEVWKAWDAELGRWVALKFLKGGDEDEIARFKREAQTAGRLNHPNICAIHELGATDAGRHWIAMQFIPGRTLRAFPKSDRRTLVRLVRDAARAIAFAHAEGIIHRDVKPENLMVVTRAADHQVYVMDFGLARPAEGASEVSVSGSIVGTPAYMPPEQARGERVDARADVWSLGATLYELLTNQKPFPAASIPETLMYIQSEDPKPLRAHQPAIDRDLETIVLKCLEKDRDQRYDSAETLAADLDRWLSGEPILARPISGLEKGRRWVTKHRGLAAALAVLVLVVGAGTALFVREKIAASGELQAEKQRSAKREQWLQRLNAAYAVIVERKADLRQLRVPVDRARTDLSAAVASVTALVDELPDEPHGWVVRGRGRLAMGDLDGAEQDARHAMSIRPSGGPVLTLLGAVLVERARWQLMLWTETGARERTRALSAEAADAFERAKADPEGASWGISSPREEEVLSTVAAAFAEFSRGRYAEGSRLLEAASTRYRSEEYALYLGAFHPDGAERIRWVNAAVEWAPGYWLAYFSRGAARKGLSEMDAAIADYDEALRLRPDAAEVLVNRSSAYAAKGEREAALRDADEALRLRPGMVEALANRANVYIEMERPDAAQTDVDAILAKKPDHLAARLNAASILLQRGKAKEALAAYDAIIAVDRSYEHAFLGRGRAKLELGDEEGALRDFDESVKVDPTYAPVRLSRANLLKKRGDRAGAMRDYDEAIRLKPYDPLVYCSRGHLHHQMGNLDAAMRDYDEAIRRRPAFPDALSNRAAAKILKKDFEGAIRDTDAAIKVDPSFAMAYGNRGNARYWTGDFQGALHDFDEAIRRGSRTAESFTSRASAKSALRDYQGAVADCTEAIGTDPKHASAWLARGNAHHLLGKLEAALRDLTEAIRLDATLVEAFNNRGAVHGRRNDLDGAIRDWTEALRLKPDHLSSLTNRATAYEMTGRKAEAIADLEKTLEVAPAGWQGRAATQARLKKLKGE